MTQISLLPLPRLRPLRTALTTLLLLSALALPASAASTTRLSANDNAGAAIAWSRATFADGAASESLLARDDVFADSLASGSAQGQLEAPLLLTDGQTLDPRVLAELRRLGTERILILGGSSAISPAVEAELRAAQFQTRRVSGPTRIETAIEVAKATFDSPTAATLARAFPAGPDPTQAFADSLTTGAFAAATAMPTLLTQSDRLTPTTRAYLDSSTITTLLAVGGPGALSEAVLAEVRALGIEVERVAGDNRFSTAVAMSAERGFPSAGEATRVILVEGQAPDAWASGFAAAAQAAGLSAPVVLANGETLPPETRAFLADADGRVALVCGPRVSDAACDAAAEQMANAA